VGGLTRATRWSALAGAGRRLAIGWSTTRIPGRRAVDRRAHAARGDRRGRVRAGWRSPRRSPT
jgi:hypothetical protein